MRAEDLFEAMGGIDEELIARSERRVRSSQENPSGTAGRTKRRRKSRRSMGSEVYRFAVITMSTAVVVFLLLMARDFLGIRSISDLGNTRILHNAEETEQESADSDTMMAEEAEEPVTEEADSAAAEEAAEVTAESGTGQKVDPVQENAAETAESEAEEAEKTAVDLLGEFKSDYVSLEYISAEDEAAGRSRTVPEYTPEGEKALSEAFEKGKAMPSIMATTGDATYYVYLTRKNGDVHKVTFYENCYVSMNNIPGVVMKISQEEYEDVMELFR